MISVKRTSRIRLLLFVALLATGCFFIDVHDASPWSSFDAGPLVINTHHAMCRTAYEELRNDPVLRFHPSYPGPAFPALDEILAQVSGPDDDKTVPYSAHVYNGHLDGAHKGTGPKRVKEHFDRFTAAMTSSYGRTMSAGETSNAARDAAWMAHFLQDLACIYHSIGVPGAELDRRTVDIYVMGAGYAPGTNLDDRKVLAALSDRFHEHRKRTPNVDWFDPYFYDGTGRDLDAQIRTSSHMRFELLPVPGSIPSPKSHSLYGRVRVTDVRGIAETVSHGVAMQQRMPDAYNPTSTLTESFIATASALTHMLWRASFCAVRLGNLELARLPARNTYRVTVPAMNFDDRVTAENVKVTYTLVEGGKKTAIASPAVIPSLIPGSEAAAPAVDITVADRDALLVASLTTDYTQTAQVAYDSRKMFRVYPLAELVRKADAAYPESSLRLTKKAHPERIIAGSDVTYTYEAENTGGFPLSRLRIEDDTCLLMTEEGGAQSGQDLPPGAVRKFTCEQRIFADTKNTAVARAFDPDGKEVASDPATCQVTIGVPGTVRLPHVLLLTREAAEFKITEAGLSVGRVDVRYDDAVPEGEVIEQSPDPERVQVVDAGSPVHLVISAGKERKAMRIMVTPPFATAKVEESVVFEADVVYSDGDQQRRTGFVSWSPGPQNRFVCTASGEIHRCSYPRGCVWCVNGNVRGGLVGSRLHAAHDEFER